MFDYCIVGAGFAGSVLAERLARGENVTVRREGGADEDEAEATKAEAEKFFEPDATDAKADGDEADAEEAPAKD